MGKKDPDIDAGWAWFVLVAVYLGIIILSTTMFMGGVLYVALLEHFDADEAKTSLVGALNGGFLCLLGPLASFVMTTSSCRICMFVGGLLSAVSCLTSAFVGSVDILILTYGVIGGIGNCLTSTPFVVVLGYYFHKRRNIVIAISQAVIGVGFFLASPLAIIIIKNYGLQGTFLILGGINAHLCVIAIVCKPSSVEQQILLRNRTEADIDNLEGHMNDETVVKLLESNINSETKLEVDREKSEQYDMKAETACQGNVPIKLKHSVTYSENDRACNEMNKAVLEQQNYLPSPIQVTTDQAKDQSQLIVYTPSTDKTYEQVELYEINGHSMTNIEYKQTESNKLVRLPQSCSSGTCNLQLLKDMPFTMFLFSTLTWNFTLSICIMHLPNYVKIQGADDVAISAIMTCFSASNLAGRFIAAMTVENGGVDSHTLHVGMLGVAGVVTLLFPFYSGPVGDYIFATVIGLYTGGPNSIMTPITLKMVNIDDLPAAHGLEYFFSGLGYVPGPFIAGLLYKLSGAYELSFITGGEAAPDPGGGLWGFSPATWTRFKMTKGRLYQDIDQGWAWVAAVSVYCTMIIKCITLYMGGVMYIAFLERFEEGKAKTSLVCALNSGLLCFLSPVSGIFINKCSSRMVIVSGSTITTVGLTVSAFINSLDAIIVTAGVIVGIGFALTTAGIIVNLGYYFQKRRNLMVTIIFVVPGIGMLISAPLGLLIFDTYGLSSSFLILAGLFAQTCVFGVLCKPSSLEKQFHRQRKISSSEKYNCEKGKYSCFDVSLICNKAFFFFLWSTCTWCFALAAASMHLPNYLKVNGGTDTEIGWLMTSFSISNMIGRLSGTLFVSQKRIDILTIHVASVSFAGVITALFPLYSAYTLGKYAFCILLGVFCGCPNAIMTTLSIQFVGVARIPEANGLSYFFCGIGISSGPVLTGFLFGLTGSYRYSFVFAGVILLLGSVFGIISALLLKHEKSTATDDYKSSDNKDEKPMLEYNGVIEKQICLVKEKEPETQR